MKSFVFSLFLVWVLGFNTQAQQKIDLTGTWMVDVQTDMGSGTPTFVLKQEGEKITGTYSGTLGESKVTGTLKGTVLHLEFSIEGNLITYDGTASPTAISGKVNLAEMAKGTFSGKRKG
ncbi:hypothetical protein [Algoriphagus sp. AK58]|uniref:hypothetical protein n=1 Tax=Algoriphagus sp. AK58 TaxID=1406877 RepID=UPI00164FC489|nr:hypothetical protein [Algoriphagus sp. AK58]MBC6368533.1 hypothetical protein [Algoriphagus sp. AK58]